MQAHSSEGVLTALYQSLELLWMPLFLSYLLASVLADLSAYKAQEYVETMQKSTL